MVFILTTSGSLCELWHEILAKRLQAYACKINTLIVVVKGIAQQSRNGDAHDSDEQEEEKTVAASCKKTASSEAYEGTNHKNNGRP